MERRRFGSFALAISCFSLLVGCGQPSGAGGSGAATGGTTTTAAKPAAIPGDGPSVVVRKFLEAVRTSNDAEALRWLTPLAREKTQEMHMAIAPPGTDTSQFEVGEVEMVEGGAHVASTWSDLDADGNRHAEPIVWILAAETEGWRIAGMATTLFEEKLPIVLNFEDPEEMLRKQQFAESEALQRAAAAANQMPTTSTNEAVAPPVTNPPAQPEQDRMTENPVSPPTQPATASRNVLRKNPAR